jgi:hypothetical protein
MAFYPDSGKLATFTGNDSDNVMVHREPELDYFDGESAPKP